MNRLTRSLLPAALLLCAAAASADSVMPADVMPGPLKKVGYDQKLGAQMPLNLPFRDEAGRSVRLGDYFGKRPVVMVFAYYECPMLCDMVLQGLNSSLRTLTFDPGKEFDVVVVSIDPGETPKLAAGVKAEILARYKRPGTEGGWHFLTGPQRSITRLTAAAGFRYVYEAERDEFAHAAGMMILTPGGKISRYLYGVDFPPRDVRLGLIESAGGKIGNLADQVLLYCFHYDPVIGRYSAVTLRILRLAAVATVLGLGLLIGLLKRRERRLEPGPLGAA